MIQQMAEIALLVVLSVLPAALLCMPLRTWALRQEDRPRLLAWRRYGALLGACPGVAYLVWAYLQPYSDPFGVGNMALVAMGMLGIALGALVGAHVGVALSRKLARRRQSRTGDSPGSAEAGPGPETS